MGLQEVVEELIEEKVERAIRDADFAEAIDEQVSATLEGMDWSNELGDQIETVVDDKLDEIDLADKLNDSLDSMLDDIDWSDKLEDTIASKVESYVDQQNLPDEDRMYDIAREVVDERGGGMSEDEFGDTLRRLLDSMPDSRSQRCSLGDSFTESVTKVLKDDETKELLSEWLTDWLRTNSISSTPGSNVPEVVATVPSVSTTKWVCRLDAPMFKGGETIYAVGPFDSKQESDLFMANHGRTGQSHPMVAGGEFVG